MSDDKAARALMDRAVREVELKLRILLSEVIATHPRDVAIAIGLEAVSRTLASLWCAKAMRARVPYETVPDVVQSAIQGAPWRGLVEQECPGVARTIGKPDPAPEKLS